MKSPLTTAALILQELSRRNGYGTDLIARISERTGIELHQGAVYPALLMLRSEGWIQLIATEGTSRGGKKRIIYGITKSGMRVAEWQLRVIKAAISSSSVPNHGQPAQ